MRQLRKRCLVFLSEVRSHELQDLIRLQDANASRPLVDHVRVGAIDIRQTRWTKAQRRDPVSLEHRLYQPHAGKPAWVGNLPFPGEPGLAERWSWGILRPQKGVQRPTHAMPTHVPPLPRLIHDILLRIVDFGLFENELQPLCQLTALAHTWTSRSIATTTGKC